ncbi:MAG: hypothetical protein IPN68_15185 [Bacteroidetes bacterium]|nr:hypothetical protein [Bacteroidota bacterium]
MIKKFILPVIISVLMSLSCFSQGTDMGRDRRPGVFIGITTGSLNSQIINSGDFESIENGNSFNGSFDFGYYISKYFGLKTGIAYSSFIGDISLDSYQDKIMTKDSENESYELRITSSSLNESQSIKIMKVPLNLVINIPIGGVVNIFIEPGLNLVIPVGNNFSSYGYFTYKGYYQEYNVLLENLPDHEFTTNKMINTDGDMELNQIWYDAVVYTGINFAIKPKYHLSAGLYYSKSIAELSGYESPGEFHLTTSPSKVNSLMGRSENVSTKALGFNITFRYFINR